MCACAFCACSKRFSLAHCCITCAGGAALDIALKPIFDTTQISSKNEDCKRGDMGATSRFIDSTLLSMNAWIINGNWQNGFGDMIIQFKNYMHRYYLRVSGQSNRRAQVQKNVTPLRTAKNALYLNLKKPRRADMVIPRVLEPLKTKLESALEYEMTDVNDYMRDMSRI